MTAPYYADEAVTLHLGEMLDVLPTLPDASVDAVVCDPPYGLANLHPRVIAEALAAWLAGDRAYVPDGVGFMGRAWDRFVPPPAAWDECLRVLKPGGHLVAFAAPRTADLMGISIRLSGFEIRDSLHWITGAGMPKGLNISKAIDRAAGAEREVVGIAADFAKDGADRKTDGSHLAPHGHQGGHRFGDRWSAPVTASATDMARQWEGWNTQLRPAHEPIILARKSTGFDTTVANVLRHGTGALNVDACRTQAGQDYRDKCASVVGIDSPRNGDTGGERTGIREDSTHDLGRWPTNVLLAHPPLLDAAGHPIGDACADACVDGCPVAEMDLQTQGKRASKPSKTGNGGANTGTVYGGGKGIPKTGYVPISRDDEGGASRFFPIFRYEAKAPASERPRLADGTAWPTVKPLALMRWLVRLITPPGGLVLDWCAGTGTTLEAAAIEGFRAIGVERERDGAELCRVRLAKPLEAVLFGDIA